MEGATRDRVDWAGLEGTPGRIREEYERRRKRAGKAPGHWFDADSMTFFGTRLEDVLGEVEGCGVVFLTSEQPPTGPRRWSTRLLTPDGEMATVGPFAVMDRRQAATFAVAMTRRGSASYGSTVYRLDRVGPGRDGAVR